uniref:Rho-GAP domain-containing protein n=1 Tax=Capra hircus TaxID=9925 RepID=A0A452EFU4_CAPHI
MSLSKLRITGSKKDYQWINFGEKKALYPLSGHGHPYRIKTRDVPATELVQQGLEDSTSASALQEALLEGPQEIQEQFILKPRHSATNQAWNQQGKDKKTVSKSSVKNWAFWCRSRTREDTQHPPLPPRKQKQIFGAPFEDVCDNDTLPTPILEMLSFINQKGPFTEGIFREPASIKSCIALKKKLNAGHKVNLDDESVLVVSSVLKDFLRNIQGSIFSAHLYDKWLAVIDQGNEEEKITATQRLVDQLPRANVVFLRYLFGVLHNIEQHSSCNQMTPYNLSVCLTPSILCLLNSGGSAFENVTKKVSLIQFLIENCLKIFGEDITSLFGENSVSCENSDITDNSEISDKKTVNKSSVKNSAFWCRSRTREDTQHPPLPPRKQKQLFGAPFEDVCDNDTLPTPILEMLSFINQKGPFTEGIFRKSASIKSCIALKEKLNAGHKVNLDDESVLVVSSVLKDFLRNIQGSIFSAHLYDKWLAVIDQGNEEEKITATQRLVDQLPKANVVLLRYLFGVLHNIEQHSSCNQMTAHDLSLYLTPSILCLLNSGSSAFENVTKKVSLIQFLIENCLKIFGEDITSLFGENSVSCDNSDITDNSEISDKKTVNKSSVKNSAFWCRSRTREDTQHPPLPPRKQKQIFGAPLEDICDNDTLPTPILEMLSFINQKGPFTEGIFRKSASIKSCIALKEKLNAGHNVNLDDESVLVVSSVLKDFLRNIQGSIFSAHLYDKWLAVIDQGNEEEKITATQRLVDQLPRANVVLLRYLFGVLHNIEQHSSCNQMTPYNLSVCLAPSILCLLNSGSSAFEKVTKKISLIQFLIENCLKIFGEDITSLFGENSVSCENSDITDNSEISDKKTVSKSSVKNWAFWCRSRTREDTQHPPLPPRKQKQIFGAPLEDICDNDTLPTPILEMLSFINQKGPFTEGIFRKSASIKSCRALKEKLNAGHNVNLDDESVLVVSSVLKDFLRNIQGSIFSARLYDKWLAVIDQGNEEEKITATQRLVDQLPRANVVLLRYLFGVLHNIEQHSSCNQMTPYNLSVCLAPSILCLLNSGSSAFENVTKKISLIQFLIENCLKIFGEDITSLFGENSVSCENSDITDNSEISGTTEQSLESKPVRVTMIYEKVQLQYDAMTSSRMGPPTDLSTVF